MKASSAAQASNSYSTCNFLSLSVCINVTISFILLTFVCTTTNIVQLIIKRRCNQWILFKYMILRLRHSVRVRLSRSRTPPPPPLNRTRHKGAHDRFDTHRVAADFAASRNQSAHHNPLSKSKANLFNEGQSLQKSNFCSYSCNPDLTDPEYIARPGKTTYGLKKRRALNGNGVMQYFYVIFVLSNRQIHTLFIRNWVG